MKLADTFRNQFAATGDWQAVLLSKWVDLAHDYENGDSPKAANRLVAIHYRDMAIRLVGYQQGSTAYPNGFPLYVLHLPQQPEIHGYSGTYRYLLNRLLEAA